MTTPIQNDLFVRACRREPVPHTPVWIMRQAGRYLPEYRAVRAEYDFLTMVRSPELASMVTVQPVDALGVDAAILFSDIMTVPEAMGMHLEMHEGRGPVLSDPVRTRAEVDALAVPDPTDDLGYVLDAVSASKRALGGRVPLIGFSGSPWTLFVYMVEGSGSKSFVAPKRMIYADPALARRLLEKVTRAVGDYLVAQADAGADALQIFDTWGGLLTPDDYGDFSLRYMAHIVERLRPYDVPVIVFSKDCGYAAADVAASGCDVVGVDWRTDIGAVREAVGDGVALQGNLDPALLFASPERIREGAATVLERYGAGDGHVFNLGHGILPDTPVENVHTLIAAVREESPKYHAGGEETP